MVAPEWFFLLLSQSKQKRIKERYGDQDEEERLARMEILAVSLSSWVPCSARLTALPLSQLPSPATCHALHLQSAGAAKEGKKVKKGKKRDPTKSTNPKHKYHQREREREEQSRLERPHKQQAPLFLSLAEADKNTKLEDVQANEESIPIEDSDMIMMVEDVEVDDETGDGRSQQDKGDEAVGSMEDAMVTQNLQQTHLEPSASSLAPTEAAEEVFT